MTTSLLPQEEVWSFSTKRECGHSRRTLSWHNQLLPSPDLADSLSLSLGRSTPSHTNTVFFTTHGDKTAEKDSWPPRDYQGYPHIRCRLVVQTSFPFTKHSFQKLSLKSSPFMIDFWPPQLDKVRVKWRYWFCISSGTRCRWTTCDTVMWHVMKIHCVPWMNVQVLL